MKELSIEEKARRYDEALKKAVIAHKDEDKHLKATLERIFHALKESRDEWIRKWLIEMIEEVRKANPTNADHNGNCSEAIAWLEKQLKVEEAMRDVEQKAKAFTEAHNGETSDEILAQMRGVWWSGDKKSLAQPEKQSEKIEPKFKVGDWVVWDNKIPCHIDNIYQGKESLMYTITDAHNMTHSYSVKGFDNNAHLWTIQDATDGDVLTTVDWVFIFKKLNTKGKPVCYCHFDVESGFFIDNTYISTSSIIRPATKEQCNQLFAKMREAGYEWYAETKELKKIEVNTEELSDFERSLKHIIEEAIEDGDTHNLKADADMLLRIAQNHAWSEEDVAMLDSAIAFVSHSPFTVIGKGKSNVIAWLKSIKDRVGCEVNCTTTWKPSEEIMKGLNEIINKLAISPVIHEHGYLYDLMVNLRKKLKG